MASQSCLEISRFLLGVSNYQEKKEKDTVLPDYGTSER